MSSIRLLGAADFPNILAVVNDAAIAYRGVIAADCWHEPYMPEAELAAEIAAGVCFYGVEGAGALLGVMGLQRVEDVHLIRHAYVATHAQRNGHGGALLRHIMARAQRPILVGTWAAATWAIDFYARHNFELLPASTADTLLRRYWAISPRQIATSVVLRCS
jgi:N-acetylglutamate synthase-like GNAT family acetyltransferase